MQKGKIKYYKGYQIKRWDIYLFTVYLSGSKIGHHTNLLAATDWIDNKLKSIIVSDSTRFQGSNKSKIYIKKYYGKACQFFWITKPLKHCKILDEKHHPQTPIIIFLN